LRGRRRGGRDDQREARKGRLKVGIDIPTPAEIKAIVHALEGSRWRPLMLTAIFTGLRSSELRGLRWEDVDLKAAELHVRQRADRYQTIGKLKTAAGERTVPLPPLVVNALREWRLRCPRGEGGIAFPSGKGTIQRHNNIIELGLKPLMIKAGVTVPVLGQDGAPIVTAKYTGLHSLRHFYASWCVNRRQDGGLELPAKVVQHRMGHSSISITLDVYGHLFPRGDDAAELAEAERLLLS
jgi:integrase